MIVSFSLMLSKRQNIVKILSKYVRICQNNCQKYCQQYVRICQNIVIKEKLMRSNTSNTASNAICDAMSEWDPASLNLVILLHISSHTVHLI